MTVLLLRHGVSDANTSGTLAGRSPGIALTPHGQEQARTFTSRLADLPITRIVTSPLQRCQDTVAPLAQATGLTPVIDERLAEVDYGDWTGQRIADLITEPLWQIVQRHASAAVFPGGEGLAHVQARAVAAIRDHNHTLTDQQHPDPLWVACTHGDIIKAILADALGLHLDGFQRIVTEPGSLSCIRYTTTAPYVVRMNDTNGDLSTLAATPAPGGEARPHGKDQ